MHIYTIGHSTLPLEDFIELLKKYTINQVIDIRRIPKSRHNPQYNKDSLAQILRNRSINYRHMQGLGGKRKAKKDSINTAWRNASFRGYADYMQTKEFAENLKKLIAIARKKNVVIMCAEAVPWRCHRSLIGDALLIHKFTVLDLYPNGTEKKHKLTPWAKARNLKITYPEK